MILIYFKNMIRGRQRFGTIVLALAIAATLLIGASGLPHMGMTMTMDEHGNMTMSDCLMPGITAVCNMTPLQHIASWQGMFASILHEQGTILLLILLVFTITWYFSHALSEPPRRERIMYRKRHKEKAFDPLRLALARGLIHSKAF